MSQAGNGDVQNRDLTSEYV